MRVDRLLSNGLLRGGATNEDDSCDVDEVVYSKLGPCVF
jgi:hypothetical protein